MAVSLRRVLNAALVERGTHECVRYRGRWRRYGAVVGERWPEFLKTASGFLCAD